MLTFDKIKSCYVYNETNLKLLLAKIEDIMQKGKTEKNLPIYTTKYRIKSLESIYLKTKRDNIDNLKDIDDIAGYRIVCLFEQDLYEIHNYIINTLKDEFTLTNFKIFNFTNSNAIDSLKNIVLSVFPHIIPDIREKASGYKSIHYLFNLVIGRRDYNVEIQLRTLLQDVWGELEHTLSYKQGNIHPHIKKSFELLAKNLENNDALMSHLKTISEREKVAHLYSMEKGGPLNYYGYEKNLIPELFESDAFKAKFEKYKEHMGGLNDLKQDKENSLKNAESYLMELITPITDVMKEKDNKLEYFINMEKAFLKYWEGGEANLTESLKIYKGLEEKFFNNYVLQFRMGEIYFIKGEIENALIHFDHCENIICEHGGVDKLNHINVKSKMAFIYWLLGHEFIEFATKMIIEAKNIYNKELINDPEQKILLTIQNDSCAYFLEKYLKSKHDDDFKIAEDELKKLENLIDMKTAGANIIDTLAWFYYQKYLKEKNYADLEYAQKMCRLIGDRENYSAYKLTSITIHKNHIQEIMSAK